jgi:hypothetical protein
MKVFTALVLLLFVGCATPKRGDLIGELFTFVGVPKSLSETTFRDVDGLERGLLVDVVKVKSGNLNEQQIEFPIPADQPSPLKIGVRYSITAGYSQHGRVILDYHEVK